MSRDNWNEFCGNSADFGSAVPLQTQITLCQRHERYEICLWNDSDAKRKGIRIQ